MSSGPGRTVSLWFGGEGGELSQGADGRPGGRTEEPGAAPPLPGRTRYRGELGATRSRAVRVRSGDALLSVEVYVSVNADTDPELGARARDPQARPLHALTVAGAPVELAVPLLYHEPSRELFALVLPPGLRHRELEERIELYRQLQHEAVDTPIPTYVLQFAVVVGAAELGAVRDRAGASWHPGAADEPARAIAPGSAAIAVGPAVAASISTATASSDPVALRVAELASWQRALESHAVELEQRTGALVRREAALQDRQRRIEARAQALAPGGQAFDPALGSSVAAGIEPVADLGAAASVVDPVPGPVPGPAPGPASGTAPGLGDRSGTPHESAIPRAYQTGRTEGPPPPSAPFDDHSATPDTIDEELSSGLGVAATFLPPGADPITTEAREQPVGEPDPWLARVIAAGHPELTVIQGRVRLALAASVIADPTVVRGPLDVRVTLHRTAAAPAVVLLLGTPIGLRTGRRDQLAAFCLDVLAEHDRAILAQLARSFELTVDLFAGGRWLRRVQLAAPLADNVVYLLDASEDYLHRLAELGIEISMGAAREQIAEPAYDVTGAHHRKAELFRDQQLAPLGSAEQLRIALAMARQFTQPEGEDYLVCVRGFPMSRWRRLRRHVLEQAVTWGIWMGSELAQVAVSEGLARSRRDLVHRLTAGFEQLKHHPSAFDLDDVAIVANASALVEEAHALGVVPGKQRTLIDSEMDSVVAGTIDLVPSGPIIPVSEQSDDELIETLEGHVDRLAAIVELCRRRSTAAAPAVVAAIAKLSRGEAVQGLAASMTLGAASDGPLIGALSSSKSYVRQGAALLLARLGSDEGIAAIATLLFTEPTEIWREVARALGQVGPTGLQHLARVVRERGLTARIEERVAWALAYLGAHDCRRAIAQMSSGHSIMAPIAAKALALVEPAQRDQQALRADAAMLISEPELERAPESAMVRALSRQLFVAMDGPSKLAPDARASSIAVELEPSDDIIIDGLPIDGLPVPSS